MLDWPIVSNIWPMKIGTNLSKEKVLELEDVGFQFGAKGGTFSPLQIFYNLQHSQSIWLHFRVLANPGAHPTSKYGKTMHHNLVAPMANHKNK